MPSKSFSATLPVRVAIIDLLCHLKEYDESIMATGDVSGYEQLAPQGVGYRDDTQEYLPLGQLAISIADLGFTQGAATYDVAHVVDGRFFRLDWHLERFRRSREGLDLPIPLDDLAITAVLQQCVRRAGLNNALVWMGVTQGIPPTGSPRDYALCQPRFYAYAKPYFGISSEKGQEAKAIRVAVSSVQRIPPQSVPPKLKNHHWLDLRRAQLNKPEGYDTVVLVDSQGNITEGPGFNVCAVRNGTVITPVGTALSGVTLRAVEALAEELGASFRAGELSAEAFETADEAFITSTSGGITPINQINERTLPPYGSDSLTPRLQALYWEKHSDPEWTTPVG
jgi:branched-chain amino acid aminotransferase